MSEKIKTQMLEAQIKHLKEKAKKDQANKGEKIMV